jgi:hypothetical protein
MLSCGHCTVRNGESDAIKADLDAVAELMPEGGIAPLFSGDTCVLCRDEHKNPRACYAMIDVGHASPARTKYNFLGIKTKMQVGSLIPVQISCCKACRRRFNTLVYAPLCIMLAALLLLLVWYGVTNVQEDLGAIHELLPLGVFVGALGIVWVAARLVQRAWVSAYEKRTYLDVMEAPVLSDMRRTGWFELNRAKRISHPIFAKERLKQGLYTGL